MLMFFLLHCNYSHIGEDTKRKKKSMSDNEEQQLRWKRSKQREFISGGLNLLSKQEARMMDKCGFQDLRKEEEV